MVSFSIELLIAIDSAEQPGAAIVPVPPSHTLSCAACFLAQALVFARSRMRACCLLYRCVLAAVYS